MDRILNPKRFVSNNFLLSLPIIEYKGIKYREWVRDESYTIKYTGCQCFKDCYCHEDDGKFIKLIKTYYRRIEFDNTDKVFYEDINYIPKHYLLSTSKES